jgi:hypothetical protein
VGECKPLVSGSTVVIDMWARSPDGLTPAAEGPSFNATALAVKLTACHPNITAWAKAEAGYHLLLSIFTPFVPGTT